MLINPTHFDDYNDDPNAALLAELSMEFDDDGRSSGVTANSSTAKVDSGSVDQTQPKDPAELNAPDPRTSPSEATSSPAKAPRGVSTTLTVGDGVRPKRSRTTHAPDRRAPRVRPSGPPPPLTPEVKSQLDDLLKSSSSTQSSKRADDLEQLIPTPTIPWTSDGKSPIARLRHQAKLTLGSPDLLRHLLLMFIAALAAIVIAAKLLGGGLTAPNSDRAAIATEDLVRQVAKLPVVTRATGSYIPKIGVVVSISATDINVEEAAGWWAAVALPFKSRFHSHPKERIYVNIDVAASQPFTRTFVAPLNRISEPGSYQAFSGLGITNPDAYQATISAINNSSVAVKTDAVASDGSQKVGAASDAPAGAPASGGASSPIGISTANPTAKTPTPQFGQPITPASSIPLIAEQLPTTGVDDFAVESAKWRPLTGQWKFREGTYQQLDNTGFDFMTTFAAAPTKNFSVSVKLKPIDAGPLNGGILLFQSIPGKRSDATIVDFTESFLRWGHYDRGGVYVYDGGYKLPAPLDKTKAVKLSVEVRSGRASVSIDGNPVASFTPYKTKGGVGLVTSIAKVAFDDFVLSSLK